jgi:glycolate oxidase FAD binding subunit
MADTLEPGDAAGVAAKLKWANGEGLAVAVRGAGTKQSWGARAARTDIVLSTLGLNAPVDHVAGDLVATVSAGVSLDAVNDVLRRERQWLPLDPGISSLATIGGIIATNDSGPRRHRYGAPRDLIIGIEIALVDGRTAKAGGKVVKNVAGYDLSKLMCGSLGTLAVVTRATFKLSPVAPYSQTLVATVADLKTLSDLALAVSRAPVSPTAIELQSPPHRLLVRFETTEAAAAAQTAIANHLCVSHGATVNVIAGQADTDAWRAHDSRIFSASGTIVKIAVLPTDVGDVLLSIHRLTGSAAIDCNIAGRGALGIVLVRLGGDTAAHAGIVSELRRDAVSRGGSLVVLSAAGAIGNTAARVGSLGDTEPIMRAVKARFDPHNLLNRGLAPWD